MCGITGVVARNARGRDALRAMVATLAHRGPDDAGLWIDEEAGVGLGHRRLAIVELSPAGAQPMRSNDGRWVLSFNGEIYNHAELRREVDAAGGAAAWRGHSDTETLVEAIALWGLAGALGRCVGMWALALWDKRDRVLRLARDRFGEKPLYYGWAGSDFLFGSEIKALRAHPGFRPEIERRAVAHLAARSYVPTPLSIFRRVFKLPPGAILTAASDVLGLPLDAPPEPGRPGPVSIERYWSYGDVVAAGEAEPINDEQEALDRLEAALTAAIKGQAMADVPVGAFLSGGIDSSAVVALYQKHSARPVRSFTIGFDDPAFNEADHAREVARHLGAEHHEQVVTARDALDVIPRLPAIYDEPFADSSGIPTFLVSRFARSQVTVALSGDGGDELFAGYRKHLAMPRLWRRLGRLPVPVRRAAGASFGGLPPAAWDALGRALPGGRQPHWGTKVRRALRTAGAARDFGELVENFSDEWEGDAPVLGAAPPAGTLDFLSRDVSGEVRMAHADALSYLPDDIMCKVDRASMANSLETRAPYLDHRVAEVAARIPIGMKVRGGVGKHVLRELLYREAPRALFERPKVGFAVPVGAWLRGPLRPWAEELLDERRLAAGGLWDAALVRARWREHLNGTRDAAAALWAVLMFQAWAENWSGSAASFADAA